MSKVTILEQGDSPKATEKYTPVSELKTLEFVEGSMMIREEDRVWIRARITRRDILFGDRDDAIWGCPFTRAIENAVRENFNIPYWFQPQLNNKTAIFQNRRKPEEFVSLELPMDFRQKLKTYDRTGKVEEGEFVIEATEFEKEMKRLVKSLDMT